MATTSPPTRPPQRPQAQGAKLARPSGARIATRTVLVGVEGIGKTTIGAFADAPVIIMAPDELGYLTLFSRGMVPECSIIQPRTWPELLAAVEGLAVDPQGHKTVVLDAMAGMESLCAWHVCQTEFNGDWGEKGFRAYGRGPGLVARTWPSILPRLTACANAGMDVLLLGHARVKRFNAPDGPDYDHWECNTGNDEVWSRTKMWAEACLFVGFRAVVEQVRPEANVAKAHGKAVAHQRIMRCQYSAVADAKNQYGLAPEYTMPDDAAECAAAFWHLIKGGSTV